MNISLKNIHFLRTSLLGLLFPNGNRRGICIRTYIYISMDKIYFGSYVRTAPLVTERKLKRGNPTQSFPLLKNMCAPKWLLLFYFAESLLIALSYVWWTGILSEALFLCNTYLGIYYLFLIVLMTKNIVEYISGEFIYLCIKE